MWPDLLRKAKEGGLDTIETYIFWNGHEPRRREVVIFYWMIYFMNIDTYYVYRYIYILTSGCFSSVFSIILKAIMM